MRFTPPAVELFSLIPADVGRPLAHLRHGLVYPELLTDAAQVLEELAPIERQVGENNGRFFLARLLPYRAREDRIAGVVLTFVDVTELNLADAVRRAQQDLDVRVRVRERTTELDAANAALRTEILRHQEAKKARQELRTRLVNAREQDLELARGRPGVCPFDW